MKRGSSTRPFSYSMWAPIHDRFTTVTFLEIDGKIVLLPETPVDVFAPLISCQYSPLDPSIVISWSA